MSDTTACTQRRILAFASVVEAGTGIALTIAPALVVNLLVGLDVATDGLLLGRCFGIALLSLAVACWPGPGDVVPALRAMALYNTLIAAYLGYLGTTLHLAGLLLWPAFALHGVVALLLVSRSRRDGGASV
jgi:hypothetical protein